jgi:hypothetical protein
VTEGARGAPRGATRLAALAALASLGGCALITDSFLTNDFSGDEFPVDVDTSTGAILVGLRAAGQPDRQAVLDVLSPITLVDPGAGVAPSLTFTSLTLLGRRGPGGAIDLPRARFVDTQLVSTPPCDDACAAPDAPPGCDSTCKVGNPAGATAPFTGIFGGDALAGDAVRLRLGADQLFILPDTGGSDRGRSLSCEAVFDSPYRGGGTMVIGDTELPFGGRRITLDACLGYPVAPPLPAASLSDYAIALRPHGLDAVLVMSTGIGVSILDEQTYQRYLLAAPDDRGALPLAQLPAATRYLPSGPITGRLATIQRLALIASSTSNAVSPCRQVHAHHLLATYVPASDRECADRGALDREQAGGERVAAIDCPCDNGDLFCDVPAVLELDQPLEFLIVGDGDRTLQALRTELRPDQPEVNGLLGTNALRVAEVDVDYPHDRLIARCPAGDPRCSARPELAREGDRCQINHCVNGLDLGCD